MHSRGLRGASLSCPSVTLQCPPPCRQQQVNILWSAGTWVKPQMTFFRWQLMALEVRSIGVHFPSMQIKDPETFSKNKTQNHVISPRLFGFLFLNCVDRTHETEVNSEVWSGKKAQMALQEGNARTNLRWRLSPSFVFQNLQLPGTLSPSANVNLSGCNKSLS